jgi:hypothetical protein
MPSAHDDIGWFSLEGLPPPPHAIVRAALVELQSGPLG